MLFEIIKVYVQVYSKKNLRKKKNWLHTKFDY